MKDFEPRMLGRLAVLSDAGRQSSHLFISLGPTTNSAPSSSHGAGPRDTAAIKTTERSTIKNSQIF